VGLSLRVHASAELDEPASPDRDDIEWDGRKLPCDHIRAGQPVHTVPDGTMSMFSLVQGVESSDFTSRQPFVLELLGMVDVSVEHEEVLLLLYHKSRDLET